jgi:hypothetical protein
VIPTIKNLVIAATITSAAALGLLASRGQSQLPGIPQAPATPIFDPGWEAGDIWNVKFGYYVDVVTGTLEGPDSAYREVVYTYTVQPGNQDDAYHGLNVAKILVEPESRLGDWLLTFDRERVALLRVERVLPTGGDISHNNPYITPPQIGQSWMHGLRQFGMMIIHDFPRLLGVSGPLTTIEPTVRGYPSFGQSFEITNPQGTPLLEVIFTRPDPATGLPHKTTFLWSAGAKWWSSATIELDGVVQVTGTLVP